MAARALYPVPIELTVQAEARAVKTLRPKKLAGLRPFRLRLFDPPQFRMRGGFPVEVPEIDIRQDHLVSAFGERLAFRPGPRELETGAAARWVADPDFYDDITFHWMPIRSDLGPLSWDSSTLYGPTLIDGYTYSINNERFSATAMNFDRDSSEHMWTTVDNLNGSTGFTVILVCTMNSAFGNTNAAGYSGIFSSGLPTTASGMLTETVDNPFQVRLVGNSIRVVTGDRTAATVQIAGLMSRTAPLYLVMAMGRPFSAVYAGKGPQDLQKVEVETGAEGDYYHGDFVLGRSYRDTLHTADMAVMDLGLYADKLTPRQVREEIALLSSVYGGEG